jgi:hypothetical protein
MDFNVMSLPGLCYCGHDCSRCLTYVATVNNDNALRAASAKFYNDEFNIDIPLEKLRCMGGRSDEIFEGCKDCPYMKCCGERGLYSCEECADYPCGELKWYQEKYVNKVNQII